MRADKGRRGFCVVRGTSPRRPFPCVDAEPPDRPWVQSDPRTPATCPNKQKHPSDSFVFPCGGVAGSERGGTPASIGRRALSGEWGGGIRRTRAPATTATLGRAQFRGGSAPMAPPNPTTARPLGCDVWSLCRPCGEGCRKRADREARAHASTSGRHGPRARTTPWRFGAQITPQPNHSPPPGL